MKQLLQSCTTMLNANGYVLLPASLHSTTVLDFLDALNTHLISVQLTKTRLHLISPLAKTVFSYVNILSEWMSRRHPAANHALAGHQPVYRLTSATDQPASKAGGGSSGGGGSSTGISSAAIASKRVMHFKWASDPLFGQVSRPPAVVVTAHPSFMLGDVRALCSFLGQPIGGSGPSTNKRQNLLKVICHDPLFRQREFADRLTDGDGDSLVEEIVLDPALTPSELVRLIAEEIRPRVLIMPDYYTMEQQQEPNKTGGKPQALERKSVLSVEQIKKLLNASPSRSTKTQMITYAENVVQIEERIMSRLARPGTMVAQLITPDADPAAAVCHDLQTF